MIYVFEKNLLCVKLVWLQLDDENVLFQIGEHWILKTERLKISGGSVIELKWLQVLAVSCKVKN